MIPREETIGEIYKIYSEGKMHSDHHSISCAKGLSDRERFVLMRRLDGLSYEDIGRLLKKESTNQKTSWVYAHGGRHKIPAWNKGDPGVSATVVRHIYYKATGKLIMGSNRYLVFNDKHINRDLFRRIAWREEAHERT